MDGLQSYIQLITDAFLGNGHGEGAEIVCNLSPTIRRMISVTITNPGSGYRVNDWVCIIPQQIESGGGDCWMILEVNEEGGIVRLDTPQQYNDYHFVEPLENNQVTGIPVVGSGPGSGAVVDATFLFKSSISIINGGKNYLPNCRLACTPNDYPSLTPIIGEAILDSDGGITGFGRYRRSICNYARSDSGSAPDNFIRRNRVDN